MSSRSILGRRRAAATRSNPLVSASRAVTAGGLGRQTAVILAASGLAFTGSIAANAANGPAQQGAAPAAAPAAAPEAVSQAQAPLRADSSVRIDYERPTVTSTPAPVVEAPVVEAPPVAETPAPAPAPVAAPAAAPAPAKITVQAAAAPAKAPAAAAGSVNASMVSSAYAQLGITQDCTAMVEKALGASGIPVGDLAPMQFMNYGSVVSTPQPGDMVVQSGHVGIFVGNGNVLSGGMNGSNQTVVHPLSWLTATGPVTFVRAAA
jgi:cell wall-associated NlpC family hydrolase